MLSCKEATHLLSESHDRKLGLGERLQLRLHLAICVGCENFRRQMDFIHRACRGYLSRQRADDDA